MSKTALITGASDGIGYELADVLAGNGVNLVIVARSVAKLESYARELEKKHRVWVLPIGKDLSVAGSPREVYDEIKERSISVDYLINNAGFGDYGLFEHSDWRKQEQMINVNITSLVHLTWLMIPDMICRGGGRIMNLASTASFQPGPTMSVYFASKAFVLSFSEAINNELKDHGITVTALCPGATHSGFQATAANRDKSYFSKNKFPSSREVAEYGYKVMMKGKPVAVHGIKNNIIAKSIGFAPRSLVVKLARKIQASKY